MPRHNKQEQQFLAMKVGETRINGTNGNTEYWSGDNYGWQSENGYNEALTKEKERADSAVDKPFWDAVDNGKEAVGQAVGSFVASIPGVREAAGAVHFVTTKVQETAQYDRDNGTNGGDYSPANIAVGVAGAWEQGVNHFANGARSNYRAVESLVENGTGIELDDRGRDAYAGAVTFAAEEIATLGAGKLLKGVKNLPTKPPSLKPATIVADRGQVHFTAPDLAQELNQPLQIASDLTRQGKWQAPVRELQKGDNTRQLAAFFRKGQGGKLKQKNLFVTADELAANKGGILDKMLDRADKIDKAWDRYQARFSSKAQRNLYDIASKNIFESGEMIYGKDAARDFLTKATNWASGDEWHHIFGNKEAGEFVLMQAAQDPLVAVNIFAKMKELGLSSSGIAENIALMKKTRHTDWHDFMKAEGFEPASAGRSEALLDFADLSGRVGKQIVEGDADINDIFRMLEAYAGFNKYVRQKLPEYGSQVIADLPEGVGKALQIGGYKKAKKRP